MNKRILFIHGGGEGAYEEDKKMAESLQAELGNGYEVRTPKMPNEAAPEYGAWSDRISGELAAMGDGAILVGHSFGASILVKYLSETKVETSVAGIFLIATPLWGVEDWEVEAYELRGDFAATLPKGAPIFLYHSRDDEWVPFAHFALYAEELPHATVREFDGRGHQFGDDLSEVARDIENL